ncbi:MAG: T9SS type A sorting domain-containing protein [Ignavibacteriales bacterium]|nr:T9SS type A sorting domain-containing protein [Ignavibacteriales bacterium]
MDYEWKHPYHFTDTLVITDNGMGLDTLFFGTAPGATDGIDPTWGESQLTPIPPAGTFDVRWLIPLTNGTRLDMRDILSYTHQQILYTGNLQAGTGGYPITFQWNNTIFPVGTVTLRDAATHGAQFSVDMRNQNSYVISNPSVTSFEILYVAPTYYSFKKGWNMVSIPVIPFGSNKKTSIFPTAISRAFGYSTLYYYADTLTHGKGYWIKFEKDENIGLDGTPVTMDTIQTNNGWTMIGGIDNSVSINDIIQIPSDIVTSNYFHFDIGYTTTDSIRSARGYWVKTNQTGKLVLSSSLESHQASSISKNLDLREFNSITVTDNEGYNQTLYFNDMIKSEASTDRFELPPLPPSGVFDIRYSSNRYVERLTAENRSLTINIQSSAYPVMIKWYSNQPTIQTLRLSDAKTNQSLSTISNGGTTRITNPAVTTIKIKSESADLLPKKFSLEQLILYNVLGQEVTTIINNQDYTAGVHTVEINPDRIGLDKVIGSGVYFYKITAQSGKENFSAVRKMLLLK